VARGEIPYGTDAMARVAAIPVIVANGASPGPRLWVNSGTHGDEAEGALALFMLLETLNIDELAGAVVAVPMLNPAAFIAGTRGDPLDTFSYDLNRIYPGRAEGYATERLANAHWEAMRASCDLQISIHSGGDHSYLSHMIFASESGRELAGAMGIGWRLVFGSATGSGNPTSQLAAGGVPAITVELGGLCRTLTKEFQDVAKEYLAGLLNVMQHYRMLPGEPTYEKEWQLGHQVAILAPVGGLFVGEASLSFESRVRAGLVLGRIYNCYGELVSEITAPEDGLVFGLQSRPQVKAGDWCCFFGVIDDVADDLIPQDGGS
jgi:predicted deacylase